MKVHFKYMALGFLLLLPGSTFSQEEQLIITNEFVGHDSEKNLIFVKTSVENCSQKIIGFWMMSCSWASSWVLPNDSFQFEFQSCDKNDPALIELEPKEKIGFFISIHCTYPIYEYINRSFYMDFVYIAEDDYEMGYSIDGIRFDDILLKNRQQGKLIRSDTIKVDLVRNAYRIRERHKQEY